MFFYFITFVGTRKRHCFKFKPMMNVTCRARALSPVYTGSSVSISESEVQKKQNKKQNKKTKKQQKKPGKSIPLGPNFFSITPRLTNKFPKF